MDKSQTAATTWTLQNDLDDILKATASLWALLDGGHFFVAGGTGFIGCWLLETLRHANRAGVARVEATVLTRDAHAFRTRYPQLAGVPEFHLLQAGVHDFEFPKTRFTHLVHAATEPSHRYLANPQRLFETVIDGTRRMLALALHNGAPRMLNLSSGSIYGAQPATLERVPETWQGAPDCTDPHAAYAEAKRCAEMLCAVHAAHYKLPVVTARVFTLIGPYMQLADQFAAGNFLRDALAGKTVSVAGDGTALRSYLYAGDLVVWLLHLLVHGQAGKAYNVGSETAVSIAELARVTATTAGNGQYDVLGKALPGVPAARYIPDTQLMRDTFGVRETVDLATAIQRSADWFSAQP